MSSVEKRGSGIPGSWVAAATAGGIIAQQVAGKAVRDALFLSSFHVESLPLAMGAAAALSLAAVFWTSRLMARYTPRRILLVLFGVSGCGLGLEWLTLSFAPNAGAVVVYLHVAVFNPIILSAFWSLVNEHFDPHAARLAVARIGMGGTLGGVLGGLGTWHASTLVAIPTTVLLLAGVNILCLIGTLSIVHRDAKSLPPPSPERAEHGPWSPHALFNAPYLRNLAILVAIGAAMSSLLDYVFSVQATAAYGSGADLLAFFSLFGFGVSVVSFLLQVWLGRVAMEKVGLAVNIALLPGIVILGGAAGLAVPGLVSATLLRGAEMVQRNTLFRAAYELLYAPLQEQQKRAAKALIDVGFDRLGTVLGSGFAIAVVAHSVHSQNIMLGAVVVLALATLPVARNLHGGYVAALKVRLREGERALASATDVNERPTLGLDDKAADALIERVEHTRLHRDERGRMTEALARRSELLSAAHALLSSDARRVRQALSGWNTGSLPLVSFAIVLLAREELQADARLALRVVAPQASGQLLDALLDPSVDFVVRRRIPAVLAVCSSQRVADGLLLGLADERFEVRYSCVRALMKVVEAGRDLVFDREQIIAMVDREIERATTVFDELDDGSDDEPNPRLELIARDRLTRSVENLFSLLSLFLERDGLRLCLRALQQENDHQRGTALEYLQTVLPPVLRDKLLPLLSDAGPIPSVRRPEELLAELTVLASGSTGRARTS
jgi:AAA family ATP:ADP antiporter